MRVDPLDPISLEVVGEEDRVRISLQAIEWSERAELEIEAEGETLTLALRALADKLDELREVY